MVGDIGGSAVGVASWSFKPVATKEGSKVLHPVLIPLPSQAAVTAATICSKGLIEAPKLKDRPKSKLSSLPSRPAKALIRLRTLPLKGYGVMGYILGYILGLYRGNGKENGNYYLGVRV